MGKKSGYIIFSSIVLICIYACNGSNAQKEMKPVVFNQEGLQNYIVNSRTLSMSKAADNLDSILGVAQKDSLVFKQTIAYLSKPLCDPNSIYRNENLYIQLLNAALQSPYYGNEERKSVQIKLQLVLQNRVGSAANDFVYMTANGDKRRMYDLKARQLLLFFYNPECEACKEMTATLATSMTVSNKIRSGGLAVLAIYIDNDESSWRKHLPEMPKEWVHGRDQDEYLYKNNVYNLKAIPTIYLLDMEKKVILKDCMDVSTIERSLN